MSENVFYVYLLLDPTNFFLPFYIGKGKNNRWLDHYNEKNIETASNRQKFFKIQKLKSLGYRPYHAKWDINLTACDAFKLEMFLISKFGRRGITNGGILLNISEGGDSGPRLVGNQNGFFGKTHSEETKLKNSILHSGKIISKEQRNMISKSLVGRKNTWGDKISKSLTGLHKSEDHCKKIGDAHRGKTISIDHRTKISQKMKGRIVSPEARINIKNAAKLREENKRKAQHG